MTLTGFANLVRSGIRLTVGYERFLNLRLSLSQLAEQVTVARR